MSKTAQLVIFDRLRNSEIKEIAFEESARVGLIPRYFEQCEAAVEAIGFWTVGIIASPGYYSLLNQEYHGIGVVEAASVLDIPMAIFDEGEDTTREMRQYMKLGGLDMLVPRNPIAQTQADLRSFVTLIAQNS